MAGIIALRFEMQRPERGRYFFAVKALLQDVQVVQEIAHLGLGLITLGKQVVA